VTLVRPTATAPGIAVASLTGTPRPAAAHHVTAILLTDARSGTPVAVNYQTNTSPLTDSAGRITGVRLSIPAATPLPARIRAYVIVDGFPLGETVL
jgi:hypothetical protein